MQLAALIVAYIVVIRAASIEFEDDNCSIMSLEEDKMTVDFCTEIPEAEEMHELIEKAYLEPNFKGEFTETEPEIADGEVQEGALKLSEVAEMLEKAKATLDLDQPLKMITRKLKTDSLYVKKKEVEEPEFAFDVEIEHPFSPLDEEDHFNSLVPILTLLRLRLVGQFKLHDDFELSVAHLTFYDFLEKCNAFLELFREHRFEPLDSEVLSRLLYQPLPSVSSVCNWRLLIEKYGILPKSVRPCKSAYLEYPYKLENLLLAILRATADKIHNEADEAVAEAEIHLAKRKIVQELVNAFDEPVRQFTWTFTDTDDKKFSNVYSSPVSFYRQYLKSSLDQLVCLTNFHGLATPVHYKINYPPRILEHKYRQVLNLDMNELSLYAAAAIDAGWPVITLSFWRCYNNSHLDAETIFEVVSGDQNSEASREALFASPSAYLRSRLFCGYAKVGAEITKWKCEETFGTGYGHNGFFCITQRGFEKYFFEVIVPRSVLSSEHLALLESTPQEL